MPALSISDRGRIAEKTPSGNAISIQTTAAPIVSESVIGAPFARIVVTGCRE